MAGHTPDRNPIEQVTAAARWLEKTLQQSTGRRFFVRGVVVFPGRSFPEVRRLSLSATEINGRQTISWFMTWTICVTGIIQQFVPAYGLTMAIWVVFAGVLNYVAYRDIFERRSANVPQVIEAPVPAQARVLS